LEPNRIIYGRGPRTAPRSENWLNKNRQPFTRIINTPNNVTKKGEKESMPKPWHKNWPEKVAQSIQYPDVPLHELLTRTANLYPKNTAIVFYGKTITYKELETLTNKFATALNDLGVKKTDRIALLLPNIPQYIISYYGALKAGATVTAISPLSKEREIMHQLNDSEAETIVALDVFFPAIKNIWNHTTLKRVIIAKMKEYLPSTKAFFGTLLGKVPSRKVEKQPSVYFFKELTEKHPPNPPTVKINPRSDLAALQYTGGTTGIPKGAMLTHYNLVTNAVMCAEWLTARTSQEVFLTVLPLFHIYGMTTSMNAAIYIAGTMVLLPRFHPTDVLKAIEQYGVTIFCGVPTMYTVLVNHPHITKYKLSTIKFCISGAAPLPPEVQRKFMKITGGVLVEGYGLTESSPVTHCNPLDPTMKTVKIGSIGIPWPDTEAKIVDIKTGKKEQPPGKVGELVVKGPQVMLGYWNMPEDTAAVLKDGWLYTGDVGKMDEDGYFFITDRKKDLIKYKGYSVYPRELEDVLYEHPAVKLCAVVGKPDETSGEIPKAFVVLKEGAKATEKELIQFVKDRVAPYKAIREIEFRKELPTSLVGKVLRRTLREEETEKQQPAAQA
jgi:long-chain acyl-CoA synthetase